MRSSFVTSFLVLSALLIVGKATASDNGGGGGRTKIQFMTSTTDPTASRFFAKIDVSAAITSNANLFVTSNGNVGGGKGKGKGGDDGTDDNDSDSGGSGGEGNGHGNGGGNGHSNGHGNDGVTGHGNGNSHSKNAIAHHTGGSLNHILSGATITFTIGSASFSGVADAQGMVSTPFMEKVTANGRIMQIMDTGLNLVELFPLDTTDGSHQVTVDITVTAAPAGSATATTLSNQVVTFTYFVKSGFAKGRN